MQFNINKIISSMPESNTIQNAFNPLTPMILFTATVSAMCLGGDLHCFGSCPTFYITNGDSLVLMSEGFSLSSNPVWEESDIDALYMAKPTGTDIRLRVTNEAYETHAIKRARLFALPRSSENNRVFRTSDGDFYNSQNLLALRNTRIGNLMGGCSITLPTSVPSCGLLIMGMPNQEERLLRLGQACERVLSKNNRSRVS